MQYSVANESSHQPRPQSRRGRLTFAFAAMIFAGMMSQSPKALGDVIIFHDLTDTISVEHIGSADTLTINFNSCPSTPRIRMQRDLEPRRGSPRWGLPRKHCRGRDLSNLERHTDWEHRWNSNSLRRNR